MDMHPAFVAEVEKQMLTVGVRAAQNRPVEPRRRRREPALRAGHRDAVTNQAPLDHLRQAMDGMTLRHVAQSCTRDRCYVAATDRPVAPRSSYISCWRVDVAR